MNDPSAQASREFQIAESVRKTCIEAAEEAYEEASMNGLCGEGAFESAIGALQTLDVDEIVRKYQQKD